MQFISLAGSMWIIDLKDVCLGIVYPISRLVLYLTEILTSPSGFFTFLFFFNVDLIEAEERIGVFILQIPQKSHLF